MDVITSRRYGFRGISRNFSLGFLFSFLAEVCVVVVEGGQFHKLLLGISFYDGSYFLQAKNSIWGLCKLPKISILSVYL